MRSSKKAATAAVLAGAVALASAAYGIGTQAGDGTAEAARDGRAQDEPRLMLRFDGLADELGVDADALEDAMRDFHEQEKGEVRDAFASALAEALGKPVDEVRAALDEVRPGDGMRPGCAPHVSLRRLAAELDVTRGELRKALREARPDVDAPFEDHRKDLVAYLAERLGIPEEKVEEALPEPPSPPDGPRFAPGGPPPLGHGGPPRLRFGMLPG
jgi:F0F1-type ATP synthase membrane subunit c/vacuolar-type H+-ATPase subunit K